MADDSGGDQGPDRPWTPPGPPTPGPEEPWRWTAPPAREAPTEPLAPRPRWGQPLPDDWGPAAGPGAITRPWPAEPLRGRPRRRWGLLVAALVGLLAVGSLGGLLANTLLREGGPGNARTPAARPPATVAAATTATTGPPPTTTMAGEEVGLGSVRPGDCFDEPDGAGDSVSTVDVMPCRQPHDAEVYAIVPVASERLPADAALQELGDRACAARFRPYVGVPLRDSALDFTFFTPTQESWAAGDRTIICVLGDPEGDPVEGSMRGARR